VVPCDADVRVSYAMSSMRYGDARFEILNRVELMTKKFEWLKERENEC